jgi:hypothetical protein
MKQLMICLLLLSILFFGCGSQASAQPEEDVQTVEEEPPDLPPEAEFDPGSISQEVFENTKTDVRLYIEKLNGIIRSKNYEGWKAHLSEDYFRHISSPDFLKSTSEMPMLERHGIVLERTEDYFTYVVVPSRANARVDDIEFTGQNRIKVFTINNRNERLRLYELEQTGNTWKIIN